jgi:hypothetical protein
MIKAKFSKDGKNPVLLVHRPPDKSFGFIEMRNPDEATLALRFDGIVLEGQELKARLLNTRFTLTFSDRFFEGAEAQGLRPDVRSRHPRAGAPGGAQPHRGASSVVSIPDSFRERIRLHPIVLGTLCSYARVYLFLR